MLVSLSVKNLALIDVLEVEFGEGLNILTGETGAGKSILIGSVNLALGERSDREMIRVGADHALIELLFEESSPQVRALMEEMELPWEEGQLLISRKIQPARSIFRINGESVTVKQVRRLAELLLDIHGQHEHQSLLHKKKHREILDGYAGAALSDLFPALRQNWEEMAALKKELAEAELDEGQREKELSLAQFEVQEIEAARIKPGEDEALEGTYRKMANGRRILEGIAAGGRLTGAESEGGAADLIGHALRELTSVSCFDGELGDIVSQLEQIDQLLHDFNREILDYRERSAFSEADFAETESRLDTLNHLKEKYGRTLEDVLKYREKREEELRKLTDFDAYRERLRERLREAEDQYDRICAQASALRREAAGALERELKEALLDLNFMHVAFRIEVKSGGEYRSALGSDDVEFMISTNVGEEARPLAAVASGGELSRIMLGLKTVIADKDAVETLIFDEIDVGISGKTAWKVSEKLGALSERRQVICITHLPQIAAQADAHFYIEKKAQDGVTKTSLSRLTEGQRIPEIARMLGGDEISAAALQNAEELIKMAGNAKR